MPAGFDSPLNGVAPPTRTGPVDLLVDLLRSGEHEEAQQWARELAIEHSFQWKIKVLPVDELSQVRLPEKRKHSGTFTKWIGYEPTGLPAYLWDSKYFKTVSRELIPEAELRREGYIAVSWTWGRYHVQKGNTKLWRKTKGVTWNVPQFDEVVDRWGRRKDRLTHLKWLLHLMKECRYFWVDVLCINQDPKKEIEREQEIAKQAKIFSAARGVIAWLWTVESSVLNDALGAFGDLVSWSVNFDPRDPQHGLRKTPDHQRWARLFDVIRSDHWFTSLWALQEIVLAPAALWMTSDGHYCTINGRVLTTRFFAIAIRVLTLLSGRRKQRWKLEEEQYRKHHNLDKRAFFSYKETFAPQEQRIQKALRREYDEAREQAREIESLVVEVSKAAEDSPWIFGNPRKERFFEEHYQHWRDWATGQSCIDCSLSATRSAILLAGRNRQVVDQRSRERALLSALKVQSRKEFFSQTLSEHSDHFSKILLNVILKEEGVQIFDVEHGVPSTQLLSDMGVSNSASTDWVQTGRDIPFIQVSQPSDSDSDSSGDIDFLVVDISSNSLAETVSFKRRGRFYRVPLMQARQLLLTSMAPSSAVKLNTLVPHFVREGIVWEQHEDWHMHEHGVLHVPEGARVQKVVNENRTTSIRLQPNGYGFCYAIRNTEDVRMIWQTQAWLKMKFPHPVLILLPLGSRGTDSIGVALIGNQTSKKETMSLWYKFGIYRGRAGFDKLNYASGILVSSVDAVPMAKMMNPAGCQRHIKEMNKIWGSLQDVGKDLEGYEVLGDIDLGSPSP